MKIHKIVFAILVKMHKEITYCAGFRHLAQCGLKKRQKYATIKHNDLIYVKNYSLLKENIV